MAYRVLTCREDVDALARFADVLRARGWHVDSTENVEDLVRWQSDDVDAVLVDRSVMRPAALRPLIRRPLVPIVPTFPTLLEEDAFLGGADDVIKDTTPDWLAEMRLKAAVEQPVRNDSWVYLQVGHLQIRRDFAAAWWRGQFVDLTHLERQFVGTLAQHAGQAVTFDYLAGIDSLTASWPRRAIQTAATRVRRAFEWVDPDFDRIAGVSGVGYRWRVD